MRLLHPFRSTLVLFVAHSLLACDEGGGGGAGSGDGGPPAVQPGQTLGGEQALRAIEQHNRDVAAQACARVDRCCDEQPLPFGSLDGCTTALANAFGMDRAAVRAQLARFDAAASAQCVSGLRAIAEQCTLAQQPEACDRVLVGQVDEGERCTFPDGEEDFEWESDWVCSEGRSCFQAVGGEGATCGQLAAAGAACQSHQGCEVGHFCDDGGDESVCQPQRAQDEACTEDEQCQSALCEDGRCAPDEPRGPLNVCDIK